MNKLAFVLIFTYKTRYCTLKNLSNNFDKNFNEDLAYLYHGIIHSAMHQTLWTSFNIIAYTTNVKIFCKKALSKLIRIKSKG